MPTSSRMESRIFHRWRIACALVEALYPGDKPWPGLDFMQLGQEYSEIYGCSARDELLQRLICDDPYVPGRQHERFLSLPWGDVFTTNYDVC